MKLYGAIAIHVHGVDILRTPRFFEKVKAAFGGKPDLRTGRQRASFEATAIVEAARDALRRLGATNAISLVIDDTVLFQPPRRSRSTCCPTPTASASTRAAPC